MMGPAGLTGDMHAAVAEAFNQVSKDASLSLTDYSHISQRQHEIEAALSRYINGFTSVLPGAFARHTMISPLAGSVIDMLVLFRETAAQASKPCSLTDKLYSILREEYADCWRAKRTLSIIVRMDDFVFRIQPGFVTSDKHYLLPAYAYDGWDNYDTIGFKHKFAKANAVHRGKLVHVVRMLKTWNRLTGTMFDGYYLELLALDALRDIEIEDYAQALCHLFGVMKKQVVFGINDPACPGMYVEGLRDVEDLVDAMQLAHTAHRIASQAIEYSELPRSSIPFNNWEKLFPGIWPRSALA